MEAPRMLRVLRLVVPAALVALVVLYQLGPARWVHTTYGYPYHFVAEIIFFGTVGPALAFVLLHFLERWQEERDTSDYQAQLLTRARTELRECRELTDDALQMLFSAGTIIDLLKNTHPELDEDTAAQVEAAERALDEAVRTLRKRLLTKGIAD